MKKTILIFLCAALLLPLFSACGVQSVVMEYEGEKMSADDYKYWLSRYKGIILYTYSDASDTDEFWNSELGDGKSAYEYLTETVERELRRDLVSVSLFKTLGFSLTAEQLSAINADVDLLVDENANGNIDEFNKTVKQFGTSYNSLKLLRIYEKKMQLLFDYLFGENGLLGITDDDRKEYYQKNYVRVKQIFVRTKDKLLVDENGKYILNSETNNIAAVPLTEDELIEKNAKISSVRDGISNGADFEKLMWEYSEDDAVDIYTNGYYFTGKMSYIDEVVVAAFDMDVGEIREVQSEYGTHFLLKYELDNGAWESETNADFFDGFDDAVAAYAYNAYIDSLADNVKVYDENKTDTLRSVPANMTY